MVILKVPSQDPKEVELVEDDDVVQALSAKGTDEALRVRVGASCRMRPMRAVRRDGSG